MDQFCKKGRLIILRADVSLGQSPSAKATCSGQTLTFAQHVSCCWSSLNSQEQNRIGVYDTAIAQSLPNKIVIRDIKRHIIEQRRPMQNQKVCHGQRALFNLHFRKSGGDCFQLATKEGCETL